MIEAQATAKYVRTSAQKAKLVLDLIRGREVNQALATLRFTRKGVSHDVAKVLRSAIANAQQQEGFGGDVDRLYVASCHANQGPSMKRTRPAPMGRGFRIVKRTAHLTVRVAERPIEIAREVPPARAGDAADRKPGTAKRRRTRKPPATRRAVRGRGKARGRGTGSAKKT
jgi:large subunit ribosomal protein L22